MTSEMERKQDVQLKKNFHQGVANVALGFPVPDTDHQKHVSSFGQALNTARLYIAMWLQAVCEREKEQL